MAIKLVTNERIAATASKGNQEKWFETEENRWYKVDMHGYEGLAETVAASLLTKTNIRERGFSFAEYRTELLEVHGKRRTGCSSQNFLREGESLLTLATLFEKGVGREWENELDHQPNLRHKIAWIVDQTIRLTNLERFGEYLTLQLELDMLFVNEDRHMNNIAVIRSGDTFGYCPLFDFGAGFLSDIHEYAYDIQPKALLRQVKARPLNCGFVRQVHAAQALYGPQLRCGFTEADVRTALDEALRVYAQRDRADICERVMTVIDSQKRKLFTDTR